MVNLLQKHLADLKEFKRQRTLWLKLSGFVSMMVVIIVVDWNIIIQHRSLWLAVSAGLILSVIWWYWTMSIIRKMIEHRSIETQIIIELVSDIKEVKKEIKNNPTSLTG